MNCLKLSTSAALALALATSISSSRAALLAYEGFDYTPDTTFTGQNGGTGFSEAWNVNNTATNNALTRAGSLTYTDSSGHSLVTSGNRGFVTGNGTATGDNTGGNTANAAPFRGISSARGSGTDTTTTWVSLLAIRTGNSFAYSDAGGSVSYGRAASFQLFNTANEELDVGRASQNSETNTALTNDTWSIVNAGNATQTLASTIPLTNLVFITLRVDHVTGTNNPGNDIAYVWLNVPNLAVEPNIADALTISASQFASSTRDYNFNRIRLFGGSDNATVGYGAMQFDEIRIGETFVDVTPFTVVPEPSAMVLLGLGGVALTARRTRRK